MKLRADNTVQILKCPVSDVDVVKGLKSRIKTVAIAGLDMKEDQEAYISRLKEKLHNTVKRSL